MFCFEKNKLFRIDTVRICDKLNDAQMTINTINKRLKKSVYKLVYSKGKLVFIYYDVITNSYVLLEGFKEKSKYWVRLLYENAEISKLKKYGK